MVDINTLFDSPATRLLAAQRALRATTFGTGRVIRAELDADGLVKFVSNATGFSSRNLSEVAGRSGAGQISTVSRLKISDILLRV